jgi:glycosyltransferase involved in cell wall biosynthesis
MEPLISVLTPTFNHGKYIQTCIQSLLYQTHPYWEMIIIDDGSTDETPDIVAGYKDPRIRYLRMEHQGIDHLGEIYNHALQISRGELIMILEGDDYIPPNRIELQLPSFKEPEVVLSHGKYAYVFDRRMMLYPTPFKIDILNNRPIGSALKAFLQGFNPIGSQSVMIRKSALLEIGGFTQPKYLPLVDYPTWMKLALKGTFDYIPELLGYWRRHPQSITINRNEEIFNAFLKYCDDFIEIYGEDLARLGLSEFIRNRGAIAYLSLAWIYLASGDWTKAVDYGKRSWASRKGVSSSFKIKMIIGLIGAYLHTNLPKYFKKLNQWLYQKGPVIDKMVLEG